MPNICLLPKFLSVSESIIQHPSSLTPPLINILHFATFQLVVCHLTKILRVKVLLIFIYNHPGRTPCKITSTNIKIGWW